MTEDYNAADEKQVKDRAQKVKNEREQELEDIKQIIKTPSGLRFLQRLMDEGMIFKTTFRGNSQSFFFEGHRNLALIFFADVCEAAPAMVTKLMIRKEEKE